MEQVNVGREGNRAEMVFRALQRDRCSAAAERSLRRFCVVMVAAFDHYRERVRGVIEERG